VPNGAVDAARSTLSVVTPTLQRPQEVAGLLESLTTQVYPPDEVILVDGALPGEIATESLVASLAERLPFRCRYIRHGGGTAVQRNVGIDAATGEFIAFVDDDIRLEPAFFDVIMAAFRADRDRTIGGITGCVANEHLDPMTSRRWRWYRRLRLFTTYEPGRFDFQTGYPINRALQPPHDGQREMDHFGAGSAVWRRAVFDEGLRFSSFFTDYGLLEDAHLALRARSRWRLLECGLARCTHLRSAKSRTNPRQLAWKTAVNYRYVFVDLVPHRTWMQEFRFWRVQAVHLAASVALSLRTRSREDWLDTLGKSEGIIAAIRMRRPNRHPSK
jgi:glycosyltransferase involved in cell wall biosynthesis